MVGRGLQQLTSALGADEPQAVGPGRYEIDVSEPPRSIALLWDTSSSVSGWTPAIIAAVRSITEDASPGRDEISLFPFHDPIAQPLLQA